MNAVVGSVPNMEAPSETEQSLSILICVSDAKKCNQVLEWCRGQDLNLRSTTHWDLIPAPLTTRVPLLELCRLVWSISE